MVAVGVYRSGYPNKKNHPFLKTLKLKSTMYLCSDDHLEDNIKFCEDEGIQMFHYRMKGNKEPFQEIDQKQMAEALAKVLGTAPSIYIARRLEI
ncbi:hypothetical protein HDV05_006771 [Chytridiales sp. JEL 0842]|nr:hypothetical protein HDV05_006771 [Chytridiales sp. JEL 0842]